MIAHAATWTTTLGLVIALFLAEAEPVKHVWHFWLAVPLALAAIALPVALLAGYFIRVTKTRYPQK